MTPLGRALTALENWNARAIERHRDPSEPHRSPVDGTGEVPGTVAWYDAQEARWWRADGRTP